MRYKAILLFILSTLIFYSCEKEYSVENGNATTGGGTAVYTVEGGTNSCSGAVVSGSYTAGVAITTAETVTIQVSVTKAGTYSFSTAVVNGISFSGSGSFATTGQQFVTLTSAGKPLEAGVFSYKPSSNSCSFSITVNAAGTPAAVFTFDGGTGACTGAVVDGTYKAGTPVTALNKATVKVNVATAGTYSISTEVVNGIGFTGTGTFTTAGAQNVILTATGTPLAAGPFSYKPGTNGCTFSVTVSASGTAAAVFTFDGGTSACTGAVVDGTYKAGTDVTALNKVTLKVNVTTPGTYSIATEVVNGIGFTGTGTFATAGIQNVILTSSGTPAAAGNFTYKPSTTACSFVVTVTAAIPPATFVLSGSPGTCAGAVIAGTYQTGTPMGSSNTVTIKVDVTVAGDYSISTNTVNGISFVASGSFGSTGSKDVVLTARGNPVASGTFTFTPSAAGNGCNFDIVVTQAPVDAGVYSCKIDGTLVNFTDRAVADNFDEFIVLAPYLYLNGYTAPPDGSNIPQLQIFITKNDNSAVGTGTYNEKGFLTPGYRIEIDYHEVQTNGDVIIWNTSSNVLSPNPPFTIIITSVSSTRVKGTFSGKLKDTVHPSNTTQKTVTEGTFDLPIQ